MDFTWVKRKEEVEVNNARIFKDYSNLEFASERVQLLERRFETKWFDYLDWKRENPDRQNAPARKKKRKLILEESDETSSEQNGEFEIKKAKSGPVSVTESDDDEDNAILDARSMNEFPKPEPELKPEAIPKTISNTVVDYSWVDAEDELDVAIALAVKDFTQLYRKGERIQLLEKLFENGWLKYCEWRREQEFEQEYEFNQDHDFEGNDNNDLEGHMEKRTSKNENGIDAKKSNIAAWYDMSSSEDEADEDEEERKSEIDESKSFINSSIDFTSLFAKANFTGDVHSSSSIHGNIENNLDDEKDKDETSDKRAVEDKNTSEIDKETSFFYDADDEAEFDKKMEL